jgi:Polyketide cyclase / dehydrase and lipid transport
MPELGFAEDVKIGAPIEAVYAYRLDFTRLPDYNPNVSNLRRIDGGSDLGVGAEYSFDAWIEEMGGAAMPQTLKVIEAESPTRIVFEVGPWYAREICTFEPDGGGTHVVFAYATYVPDELDNEEGRALIEQSGRRQARLELDLIKENLEGFRGLKSEGGNDEETGS